MSEQWAGADNVFCFHIKEESADGRAWKGTAMRIHEQHDLKTSQHEDYIGPLNGCEKLGKLKEKLTTSQTRIHTKEDEGT